MVARPHTPHGPPGFSTTLWRTARTTCSLAHTGARKLAHAHTYGHGAHTSERSERGFPQLFPQVHGVICSDTLRLTILRFSSCFKCRSSARLSSILSLKIEYLDTSSEVERYLDPSIRKKERLLQSVNIVSP